VDKRSATNASLSVIEGDSLKLALVGYPADHPLVADLKRKSFFVQQPLDDAVAMMPNFIDEVTETYTVA
jgi:uncharacterized protein (DUF2461 family)